MFKEPYTSKDTIESWLTGTHYELMREYEKADGLAIIVVVSIDANKYGRHYFRIRRLSSPKGLDVTRLDLDTINIGEEKWKEERLYSCSVDPTQFRGMIETLGKLELDALIDLRAMRVFEEATRKDPDD